MLSGRLVLAQPEEAVVRRLLVTLHARLDPPG
jgi:hypothetical protein